MKDSNQKKAKFLVKALAWVSNQAGQVAYGGFCIEAVVQFENYAEGVANLSPGLERSDDPGELFAFVSALKKR